MEIDMDGKVTSYDIQKTFINSKRRMNYDEVNHFFKKNHLLGDKEIENMLLLMNELSLKLKNKKRKRRN
jgi:ribonuclease R